MDISREILRHFPASLFRIPGPFVLAVSGGRDSMLLLRLFTELRRENLIDSDPLVFHLNHGLRPEAERETELVRRAAREAGFSLREVRRNARIFSRRARLSLEEGGRRLRYRALSRICFSLPGSVAVTAHHADDFAESLLLHLTRGGGPGALNALPLFGNLAGLRVFRPLLCLDRARISELVREQRIDYLDDPSNEDSSFKRNRIRSSIVPLLKEEGLDAVRLWRNFHHEISPEAPGAGLRPPVRLFLDRRLFPGASAPELKAILDPILRALGIPPASHRMTEELQRRLKNAEENFRLRYETSALTLWSAESGPVWALSRASAYFRPARFYPGKTASSVRVCYGEREREYVLTEGEEIVSWSPGARVALSPKGGGTKKIKKIYQELRLPPPVRRHLPLIRSRGLIVRICASFWNDLKDLEFPAGNQGADG